MPIGMTNMTAVMPLIYFLAGIFATFLAAFIYDNNQKEKPKTAKTWSKIDNIKWQWEYDYDVETKKSGLDVARLVAQLAVLQLEQDREKISLSEFEVLPSHYTIKMSLNASFIKRDK